jgi:hypothetical protein
MHAALIAAIIFFSAPLAAPVPIVEQTVEFVSVAHLADGAELIFIWADVQGEITVLGHRWLNSGMGVHRSGDEWVLAWEDEGDSCYRVIHTRHWLESWENENPLAAEHGKPWFRQLCEAGLKSPPRAKP